MKILYVSTISNTINAFMIPHIEMLINQGHKVDIACNIDKDISPILIKRRCRVFNIEFQRSPLSKKNYFAYKELKKLINRESYDIVHTHTPVASFIARLVCKKNPNIKSIYTAHGFHFYKGAPIKNWLFFYPLEKWLSRFTDCLITINNEDYNVALNKKFKAKEIKKIHGVGVNLSKFYPVSDQEKRNLRRKHGFNENDFILIYPAELNTNKNQLLLINAVNLIKDKVLSLRLILAGNGPLFDHYKKRVTELNLSNNIILAGYRKDIDELLQLSDVSVASSIREGLPVNIMEAMACGLPIVATKNRGHRELIKHGQSGYLVDLEKTREFADSIYKLYLDKKRREEMGEYNLKIVDKYSVENVCQELETIYKIYLDD